MVHHLETDPPRHRQAVQIERDVAVDVAEPLVAGIGKGAGEIRAGATWTKGDIGTPSTSSRTSLIHSRRGPSEPIAPTIGRVVHLPFMPSRGSVGAGIVSGSGASQFAGDQTLPGAFSVRRNNWQEARAMLVPPEKNSASITLMRMPSRTSFVVTSTGVVDVRQAEHVDGQPRRHEIVGAVALLDHKGQQADDDAAVHRVRVPRSVRDRIGDEGVAASG